MRSGYGYDSYRGRSGFRTFLTVVIVVLVLVLLAAVAAFVFLQGHMVYGDDGQVRFDLPFFRNEERADDPVPSDELIIVTASPEEGGSAPARYSAAPSAQGTAPSVQGAVPSASPGTAGGSAASPASQSAAPSVQGTAPSVQSAVPSASPGTAGGSAASPASQSAAPSVQSTAPPSSSPVSGTPAAGNGLRALALSEEDLSGKALTAERLAGYNAVLLDMKRDDGWLGYVSGTERAKGLDTNSQVSGRNAAVKAVLNQDAYAIARLSCFRDYRAPRQNNTLALRSTQGNWLDPGKMRWLNPSVKAARTYLVGLCAELAEMGFDEILLDNAFYPYEGKLNLIIRNQDYVPGSLDGPVETFYQEVRAACPGVKLSIAASPEGLEKTQVSGQSAQLLAKYADRVYVRTGDGEALKKTEQALVKAGLKPEQIVCWHTQTSGGLSAGGGEALRLEPKPVLD